VWALLDLQVARSRTHSELACRRVSLLRILTDLSFLPSLGVTTQDCQHLAGRLTFQLETA
jgi:hypothetical protein